MTATSIVEADDEVVAAALAVLDGDAPEGTENLRRGETRDGAKYVYRVDPDAEGVLEGEEVTAGGEFPDADETAWRADREEVERAVGRRGIEETGRSTAGEDGGNR